MENWALILGASNGIGSECALRLAKKGLNCLYYFLINKILKLNL